jgi:hypothetical protein
MNTTMLEESSDPLPETFATLVPHKTVMNLFIAAVLLPMGIVLLCGFSAVFALFGDNISAAVLAWTAFAFGSLWILDLISLLLCLTIVFLFSEEK